MISSKLTSSAEAKISRKSADPINSFDLSTTKIVSMISVLGPMRRISCSTSFMLSPLFKAMYFVVMIPPAVSGPYPKSI